MLTTTHGPRSAHRPRLALGFAVVIFGLGAVLHHRILAHARHASQGCSQGSWPLVSRVAGTTVQLPRAPGSCVGSPSVLSPGAPRATAGFAGAIALDSTHVAARTHRAEMAAAMGAYARAITDFGVAVAVDPAFSRAWFGLGRVLDDTGEWHRAAQAYRQFLSHWPQDDARARHARERLRANEERH